MVELIFNAPDLATLAKAAVSMGFYDSIAKVIETTGPVGGGGGYFLNLGDGRKGITVYQPTGATTTDAFGNTVPVMAALPGVWGRLRHNGDPTKLPALPANSGITVYQYSSKLNGWTADGATLAPAYVANVGVIA